MVHADFFGTMQVVICHKYKSTLKRLSYKTKLYFPKMGH